MSGDPLWMRALLAMHVAAGVARRSFWRLLRWSTAKGGKQHKRWGMVYFWAMGGGSRNGAADGAVSAGTVSGADVGAVVSMRCFRVIGC